MIRNYLLIAIRNTRNALLYSAINVFGLSIGIACCLLIALFIMDEYSYDRYHERSSDIYRVVHRQIDGNRIRNVAVTQGVLGPELENGLQDVEAATRVGFISENISVQDKEPQEARLMAVDPSFLKIFTVPLSVGSSALSPESMLINETAAKRIFGKDEPIGKVITINGLGDVKVTGVFKDFPSQSHLSTDYLISFAWIEKSQPQSALWTSNTYYNYVLMKPDLNVLLFNKNLNDLVHRHVPDSWKTYTYFLQPLTEIRLDDSYHSNAFPTMGKSIISSITIVGIIILVLASVNYMNLATARSVRRAMEVGIRKAIGASRGQLVRQFLTESFMICLLGFFLAILWADLALPFFNSFLNFPPYFSGRNLSMHTYFSNYKIVLMMLGSLTLLAIAAGSYPAFFLSKFLPVSVLKGAKFSDSSRRIRKILVLMQFSLTGILVIMAMVVFNQTEYMKTKDLGFNKDQLLFFRSAIKQGTSLASFKSELMRIPGVVQITSASTLPGRTVNLSDLRQANTPEDQNINIGTIAVDHDYIEVLQLKLLAGRNFKSDATDEKTGILINEKAANDMGWSPAQAIGKKVTGFIFSDSLPGEVIGVVNDFHASSLRKEIMPMALNYRDDNSRYMARLEGTDLSATRNKVNELVRKQQSDNSFNASLTDEYLDNVYLPEDKTGVLLSAFTLLAIIIGAMGLYALAAYEGEQRIKELGIRKIMGATPAQLLIFLSRNFMMPVLIALVIALPLAYLMANVWLHSFPYRSSLTVNLFLQSGIFILLLGWITIAAQAIKASKLNPAQALKHE